MINLHGRKDNMQRHHVLSGVDHIETVDSLLSGKRVGLMTNPTGVDHNLRSTIDIIRERCNLTALFAVEHGIRGSAQAGAKVDTCVDEETGVTVYSAFGANCHFNQEMLDAFDVLIFDIQDVGARFYTYLYSLSYAMEACARSGKAMIVLDRVNPLGGIRHGGTILELAQSSFVGDYELPTQYALTIGEYARYVKDYLKLDVELTVVPLTGWERWMRLDDTDLPWVAPSPNCQNLDAALCYIGTCIFEGTNVSEGRGTTMPFQVIGAPFLDDGELERRMAAIETPGIHFRRTSFCPTFHKHEGQLCHGVQMHIVDRDKADVFSAGLLLLEAIREMAGDKFSFVHWGDDPRYAIDKLLGTDAYRTGRMSARELIEASKEPVEAFIRDTMKYRLY